MGVIHDVKFCNKPFIWLSFVYALHPIDKFNVQSQFRLWNEQNTQIIWLKLGESKGKTTSWVFHKIRADWVVGCEHKSVQNFLHIQSKEILTEIKLVGIEVFTRFPYYIVWWEKFSKFIVDIF